MKITNTLTFPKINFYQPKIVVAVIWRLVMSLALLYKAALYGAAANDMTLCFKLCFLFFSLAVMAVRRKSG